MSRSIAGSSPHRGELLTVQRGLASRYQLWIYQWRSNCVHPETVPGHPGVLPGGQGLDTYLAVLMDGSAASAHPVDNRPQRPADRMQVLGFDHVDEVIPDRTQIVRCGVA